MVSHPHSEASSCSSHVASQFDAARRVHSSPSPPPAFLFVMARSAEVAPMSLDSRLSGLFHNRWRERAKRGMPAAISRLRCQLSTPRNRLRGIHNNSPGGRSEDKFGPASKPRQGWRAGIEIGARIKELAHAPPDLSTA